MLIEINTYHHTVVKLFRLQTHPQSSPHFARNSANWRIANFLRWHAKFVKAITDDDDNNGGKRQQRCGWRFAIVKFGWCEQVQISTMLLSGHQSDGHSVVASSSGTSHPQIHTTPAALWHFPSSILSEINYPRNANSRGPPKEREPTLVVFKYQLRWGFLTRLRFVSANDHLIAIRYQSSPIKEHSGSASISKSSTVNN